MEKGLVAKVLMKFTIESLLTQSGLLFPFSIIPFYTDLDVLQGCALNVHYEKMASADQTTSFLLVPAVLSLSVCLCYPHFHPVGEKMGIFSATLQN